MNNFYDTCLSVIESGRYILTDILAQIDRKRLEGVINDEQYQTLVTRANQNVNPEEQTAPTDKRVEALATSVRDLTAKLTALTVRVDKLDGGHVAPEQETVITDWVPWNHAGEIPYQVGTKVKHNGKTWESMVANNVWEPGAFGVDEHIWKEVVA